MQTIETPVLIVGGGGAGLTASMLFSQLGVETLLVSALPTTSILPKAHVLNQRCMEVFTDVGVAEEIRRRGTPPEQMRRTAYYAGLAGPDPVYGRQIGSLECWGGGGLDPDWASASPCLQANLPQIRLEPILKARAEALSPGRVRFHHELVDLAQDADGVTATVRDKDADRAYQVRARYLLACDGGRTVGPKLGVALEGPRDLMRIISVYMTADLSRWATDPDVLLRWLWLPDRGVLGTLVPMGPDHWGPDSEEWVFHLNYENADTRALDDAYVVATMKEVLGVPDLDPKVQVVSRWSMEGILADRFRAGRVFLVGDAAHRHPPTGGLGLTSAVHDAAEPVLEDRGRARRPRRRRAARFLRARAARRRRPQRAALARERDEPRRGRTRDRRRARQRPREEPCGAAQRARRRSAPPRGARRDRDAVAFAKPGHVLFGSDWPYAPAPAVSYFTGQLDAYAALDAAGHAAIDRGNAEQLFPGL